MFRLANDVKVYLHREPVDFRCGIDGLVILVEQSMHLDPWERAIFAFCNRSRDRMRLLFYDRSGFMLLMKRLEVDRFRWPRRAEAVLTLTTEQIHWLLDSIDIEAVSRHPVRHYQSLAGGDMPEFDNRLLRQQMPIDVGRKTIDAAGLS